MSYSISTNNNMSTTPTNSSAFPEAPSEDTHDTPSDPDIPRLFVVTSDDSRSVNEYIYRDSTSSPMRMAESDDESEERESDGGNEQDDEDSDDEDVVEDEEEDDNQTDRAEDFSNEPDNDDEDDDDVEASFIKAIKPKCSKTKLVSCLSSSSRSTSPGLVSPLLSEDEFSSLSCGGDSSSGGLSYSRSSSMDGSTPRVRFKRGCVISEVNLTWAAASYDRAPIDVAESLDMKRCQSIEDCIDASPVERIDMCTEPSSQMHEDDSTPLGSQNSTCPTIVAPPSPPLQSSPCTAAQANYAYSTTFGEMFGLEGLDTSSIPSLSPDESSSMNSGSDSEDCHWSYSKNSSSSSTLIPLPTTSAGHPSALSVATAQSSLGLAAMELEQQCREEEEYLRKQYHHQEQQHHHEQRGRSASLASFAASTTTDGPFTSFSSRPSLSRRGTEHEISPPPSEEQPARKAPRYGLCAMGKFSRESLDACDALGGF